MTCHPRLLDLRAEQTWENKLDACAVVAGKVVQRPLESIKGVTLHQTACYFSVAKYQLKAAGGDVERARHIRGMAVNAHITAMRHGKFVLAHSFTDYVNHGHQLNGEDVGLEHEVLCDVNGVPVGPPEDFDMGVIIDTGRAALEYIVEMCPHVEWVDAHRQAMRPGKGRGAKTSDPGRRIFKEVGVEWGVKKLGLKIRPEHTWGIGKPLPENWWK